jgi:hypothetical protein
MPVLRPNGRQIVSPRQLTGTGLRITMKGVRGRRMAAVGSDFVPGCASADEACVHAARHPVHDQQT